MYRYNSYKSLAQVNYKNKYITCIAFTKQTFSTYALKLKTIYIQLSVCMH